ncbi:MAG: 6-phosphofructokinase [Pyramidobacter sp.]|nr:6-phosphofructokinase [Pyramidobacter sp.]
MKQIAVLTSGGDAPGMNAAIRAAVRCGIFHGLKCFGVEQGYEGLIDGLFRPLDVRDVGSIIQRGGTLLRTSRSDRFMTPEGRREALRQCQQNEIDGLIVIGGDGSFRGAWEMQKLGLPVVGVPATIDNDVNGTDMTIGFDTALNTALDAVRRLRDTAHSHDRLFIVEVMGRHSGSIALQTGVAGGADFVVVPEIPFDLNVLCEKIELSRRNGKFYSVIVLAEGVMSGYDLQKLLAEHSPAYKATVTVLGHIQRGGAPSSYDATIATRMGAYAVNCLLDGRFGVMTGVANGRMTTLSLPYTWEKKKTLNPELLELVRELSI